MKYKNYLDLPFDLMAKFRSYKSQAIKKGLTEEEAITLALAKVQPNKLKFCNESEKFSYKGAFKNSIAKYFAAFAKSAVFFLFVAILFHLGIKANPEQKLMVAMIEVMALVGLCFPAKIFHPIWQKRSHPWIILRSCGLLAVALSWLNLNHGADAMAQKHDYLEGQLKNHKKAIAIAWKDHDSLPVNFVSQKRKL